ncbi:MAG: hypothetical protein ACRCZ2_00095 [Fusobacteriaceae bacterium]
MKRSMLIFAVGCVMQGCSTAKIINNKEQTFAEFVILNKNTESKPDEWLDLEGDSFPVLRLIKWYKE